MIRKILYFTVAVYMFSSCENPEEWPAEPELSFVSWVSESVPQQSTPEYLKIDATISFGVIDGDGDIGLNQADTLGIHDPDSLHYHDLFMVLYEKIEGEFVLKKELEIPLNYRIPYWEPTGFNRTLKANIEIDIDYFYTKFFNSDTIKFGVHIYDRSLNKSNELLTPELPLIGYLPLPEE